MPQSLKHLTLDFGSVYELRVLRSSPVSSDFILDLEPTGDSLSPSPSASPSTPTHLRTLS